MKIIIIILFTILSLNIVPIVDMTTSNNNLSKQIFTSKTEYESNNCKVSFYPIINSKYSDGKIFVIKIFKNKMKFEVTKSPSKYDFYINSNFFSTKPLGEVLINDKIEIKKKNRGGFFVSQNNSFDFTINKRPNNVTFSSQTHLIGIKNGKINKSIIKPKWSRKSTYRILLGEDVDGNFVAIHSNRFAMISIKEICEIGLKEKLVTGLVFDGGTSVDVNINDGFYNHSFSAVPKFIRFFSKDLSPPVYISGNFK